MIFISWSNEINNLYKIVLYYFFHSCKNLQISSQRLIILMTSPWWWNPFTRKSVFNSIWKSPLQIFYRPVKGVKQMGFEFSRSTIWESTYGLLFSSFKTFVMWSGISIQVGRYFDITDTQNFSVRILYSLAIIFT